MSKKKHKIRKSPSQKQIATQATQSISFAGPLPPPAHFGDYERILPGAAERILKMAEEQSEHRKKLEIKVIDSGIDSSKKGLWFGFIIGLVGFVLVGYCAHLGYQWLAGGVALSDLGSLVYVFVYGSKQRREERVEKEAMVQQDR